MPIIIKSRRKFKFKISEIEFKLTKLLLDNLDIDYESDYTLSFNYLPIIYNNSPLCFAERYISLLNIPNNKVIFRPIKNDKHANILIDMFDRLGIINSDNLIILSDGDNAYKGYFTYNGKKIEKSYTYNAPTIPILKSFMVAKLLLDSDDYNIFLNNLLEYNRINYKNRRVDNV